MLQYKTNEGGIETKSAKSGDEMDNVFREIKQSVTFFSTRCLDFPAHIHEEIELVYVRRGTGVAYCDGKRYVLSERSFFWAFPNQVHHYTECNQGDYILLIIKPQQLLGNHERYLKGYPTEAVYRAAEDDTVTSLLEAALVEYDLNSTDLVIQSLLTAFFEKLIGHYDIEKGTVSSDTVWRILQYCSAHYKDELTVTDIAKELGLSKSTVSHIFSQRLGISFYDHLHTLRLGDAVQLLKNKHYSVTEIAAMAGFPTIRTFNRVFQKQYGVSPSAYRRML